MVKLKQPTRDGRTQMKSSGPIWTSTGTCRSGSSSILVGCRLLGGRGGLEKVSKSCTFLKLKVPLTIPYILQGVPKWHTLNTLWFVLSNLEAFYALIVDLTPWEKIDQIIGLKPPSWSYGVAKSPIQGDHQNNQFMARPPSLPLSLSLSLIFDKFSQSSPPLRSRST